MYFNKKIINIFILILMIFTLLGIFNKSYAIECINENKELIKVADSGDLSLKGTHLDRYKPDDLKNVKDGDKLAKIGNKIIGLLQLIGSSVSIVVMVLMGVKYILASAEMKAEYKKTMQPYCIGCIMVFGIVNILSLLIDIINSSINNSIIN